MLAAISGHCRAAAASLTLDPTLDDEPEETGLSGPVYVLVALAETLPWKLVDCFSTVGRDQRPVADRWAEAEALARRAGQLAVEIGATIPRADHTSPEGLAAISRRRLAARHADLSSAADDIRQAAAAALRITPPAPAAVMLLGMADQLEAAAAELVAEHDRDRDALAAAFGRRQRQDEQQP